jgi:hypothetical protein
MLVQSGQAAAPRTSAGTPGGGIGPIYYDWISLRKLQAAWKAEPGVLDAFNAYQDQLAIRVKPTVAFQIGGTNPPHLQFGVRFTF